MRPFHVVADEGESSDRTCTTAAPLTVTNGDTPAVVGFIDGVQAVQRDIDSFDSQGIHRLLRLGASYCDGVANDRNDNFNSDAIGSDKLFNSSDRR